MANRLTSLFHEVCNVFAQCTHAPSDPEVIEAYDAFKRAILAQYFSIPYRVIFTDADPYADSATMLANVALTGELCVFTGGTLLPEHPLAEVWKTSETGDVNYNHLFRAVHDGLVHIPYQLKFSPTDEFKAFKQYADMLSRFAYVCSDCDDWWPYCLNSGMPYAIRALATETLAHTAYYAIHKSYAPQKATLLPDDLIIRALRLTI